MSTPLKVLLSMVVVFGMLSIAIFLPMILHEDIEEVKSPSYRVDKVEFKDFSAEMTYKTFPDIDISKFLFLVFRDVDVIDFYENQHKYYDIMKAELFEKHPEIRSITINSMHYNDSIWKHIRDREKEPKSEPVVKVDGNDITIIKGDTKIKIILDN